MVRFFNGKLNMITSTGQFGEAYETSTFTLLGVDEFLVIRKNRGRNSYLPCGGVKYTYRNNLLEELKYVSFSGQLMNNASGVAIIKYKRYDDKNRFSLLKEMSFYDVDGHPVISKSEDCHKIIYEYDEKGNQLSHAYYGINNEALANRFGGFKSKYQYDDNDKLIKNETIGVNEELTVNSYGYARVDYAYRDGFAVKETRYDDKNVITKGSAAGDGFAIIRYEYDDKGNNTQISYFDEANLPVNNHSGYQRITYKFSSSGMLTGIKYFNKDQAAAVDQRGIHEYAYQRDNQGRVIQMAYFDKDDNPVKDNLHQVFMLKYKYDEFGRDVSTSYWKDNATKMPRWNGFHESITRYDENGQSTEVIYLDESGNLFKTSDGYSRQVMKYNSDANISERKFFDNSTPVMLVTSSVKNYHSIKYSYDANKRISFIEYFDGAGNPTNATFSIGTEFSCHKIEFVYKGSKVVQENCFMAGSDTPVKFIDCLTSDYVNTNGVNTGYKNQ